MSRKQKRISAFMGVLTLLGILVTMGFKQERNEVDSAFEVITTAVVRKPMTIVVTSSGEIEALNSRQIIPKIRSSAVISYLVEEGARVKKGAVIGRLNGEDLEIQIETYEQDVEDLKVQLKDAEAELEVQEAVNNTNITIAEDNLKAAELKLKKFDEADTVMTMRAAELQYQTAESNLRRSEKRYEDLQTLFKEGFITEDEVEEGRITVEQERVNLETAKMDMQVLSDFTFPLDRNDLSNQLSKAKINLQKARTESESLLNTRRRAVQKVERNLAATERTLEARREILSGYVITAPTDGVVYYGGRSGKYSSRANIEIGGTIYSGYTMFTIPDLTGMKAEVDVAESEIHKLELELPVSLKVDAVPEKIFSGKIIKIAEVANDGGYWRGGGVKEFEVEVAIDDDAGLKPGYSCKAEVVTDEVDSTLQLPIQAVFRSDEGFYVYSVDGKKHRVQPVEIGRSTITHVEILDGLEEGQRVLLTPPKEDVESED